MSQFDDLLAALPVSQLAARVGADEAETEQAVRQLLPALVGGMQLNAQDPQGAESLAGALRRHETSPVVDGGVNLDQVDPEDGRKIVGHVFGDNTDVVVNRLGATGGASNDLVKKLLPILAPIVLSWLARKLSGSGGLGGVLGDALGGDAPTQKRQDTAPAGQGGVGDLLGDLLGGALGKTPAQGQSGGVGLDDLLGGLLGGKR